MNKKDVEKYRRGLTLRELINKLESFSGNGEFDDIPVVFAEDWRGDVELSRIRRVEPYYDGLTKETFISLRSNYGRRNQEKR